MRYLIGILGGAFLGSLLGEAIAYEDFKPAAQYAAGFGFLGGVIGLLLAYAFRK